MLATNSIREGRITPNITVNPYEINISDDKSWINWYINAPTTDTTTLLPIEESLSEVNINDPKNSIKIKDEIGNSILL